MSLIRIETHGHIQRWTLDRPDRLNALPDPEDGGAFRAACEGANADRSVRCIVMTGAGRAFSAGGDLKAMKDRRDLFAGSGVDLRDSYRRVVHQIVRALYDLEVPLIAAVNGPAMGLGGDIAGLADIRIASETATFGAPFLKLGILPGDGGAWLLPRNIGYARAAELLFTGRSINATTALEWGLVNSVVPPTALMDAAMALAAEVTAQAPQALRMTKALLRQGRDLSFDAILEMTAAMQAIAHMTDDHIEGVTAVLEKRPADFTGR
ncbi:crotonase/enoyl-CoA hydratase family protein [Rhizobium sp. CRIBSB]|nr:crotonase/enoyl-CoA hydratase family protein [Rhizobium sp. CRIBSB]